MASNRPGGRGSSRHLGLPPGEHGRTLGIGREPRCAGEFGRRRLLSDPGQGRRALLRQPGSQCGELRVGDVYFTRNNPTTAGRSPVTLAVLRPGRTPLSTSRAPRTWKTMTTRDSSTSRRSSAVVPGDIYVSPRLSGWNFGGICLLWPSLNDAGANDIQPNVREGRARGGFSSNRVGGIGTQDIWISTRARFNAPWSAAGERGSRSQHRCRRDAALPVTKCAPASLRARARPGGHRRHLRQHPDRAERELILGARRPGSLRARPLGALIG